MDSNIFENMFNAELLKKRNTLWKILCKDFFQRYIDANDTVLDLGAGFCEFINNIKCKEKIAVDLNEHTPKFANSDVKVFTGKSTDLETLVNRKDIDAVFVSNFLEHMKDKTELYETLAGIKNVLKPGGKILILQPNIRYAYKVYWDFIDHNIPISHKSLEEITTHLGFKTLELKPRFLPWTTKSNMPINSFLVKLYLWLLPAQLLLGKQLFLYALKED